MTVVPHSPYFTLMIKLEDRHFDTIKMIEAESQVVMNTAGNCAYARKGIISRLTVANRLKASV
jgi:hypothetical protein